MEARSALSFALGLFDSSLEEQDGDGPWSKALTPPETVLKAVAGYIWAALAAPESYIRWEAAHVIRLLCSLDIRGVLDPLVSHIQEQTGGPYADSRLHFYHLHAQLWLLVALARAALENPAAVAPYADAVLSCAVEGEPHVLIRHFAATCVRSLADAGQITLAPEVQEALERVNAPTLPVQASGTYDRQIVGPTKAKANADDDKFYFGIDFGPYWFQRLGRCFALSQAAIEQKVWEVIRKDWDYREAGGWRGDARHARKLYRERETYHSHGSYPRTNDLTFYLAYHAMMVVAGKLLTTTPVHQDPEDLTDDFGQWLADRALSRSDGRWLADRRDPTPLERPAWKSEKSSDEWPFSVQREDLDPRFFPQQDALIVAGDWTTYADDRSEEVQISSALVSPTRANALLRALQTTSRSHDAHLPYADNHSEIDEGAFQLRGWIEASPGDSRLDKHDPWAGEIRYPPLRPAAQVCEHLRLRPDADCRDWFADDRRVMWSQVWGTYKDRDRGTDGERGVRLYASLPFITELLAQTSMSLIMMVQVERRMVRASYESNNDDYPGYLQPYLRIFLLSAEGTWQTL
jgi:hypothetical protein